MGHHIDLFSPLAKARFSSIVFVLHPRLTPGSKNIQQSSATKFECSDAIFFRRDLDAETAPAIDGAFGGGGTLCFKIIGIFLLV
jgi:hypothetical protein